MGDLTKDFSRWEFECNCGCGLDKINPELVAVAQLARSHFNARVDVESGCRCEAHNKAVGGATKSRHKLQDHGFTDAADIKVQGVHPHTVYEYLDSKFPHIYGIGRYNTFTHIDVRPKRARW